MLSQRSRFEFACRICVFALIGWLVGTTIIPPSGRRVERVRGDALAARLIAWTRATPNVALHGDFTTTPAPWAIDWLAALAHSGHVVTWSGSPPPVALGAESLPGPDGGVRIAIGAPDGTRIALHDDASAIDSVRVATLGASVTVPFVAGDIVATAGNQRMSVAAPDSTKQRTIVVLGEAGWEGKFVVAALEARGWPVIARFSVAPNVEVDQGATGALVFDTSSVAAVIAIDTTVARYAEPIARFVRSGGGLVLAGPSGLTPAVAAIAPGSLGRRTRPAAPPKDTISLGSTGIYPISALEQDGVVLERRPDGVAVAARRVGAGRVIELGYDDSWRWRMAGGPGSEAAHRDWWSRVVAAVVYLPSTPLSFAPTMDESAPLAHLVDRLGPSRAQRAGRGSHAPLDRRLFLSAIMILLLAEWASRRLRGLR